MNRDCEKRDFQFKTLRTISRRNVSIVDVLHSTWDRCEMLEQN